MEDAFKNIHKKNIWGGGSGTGSKMSRNNKKYIEKLLKVIEEKEIHTICDVGCGDWEFSQHIDFSGKEYLGIDCIPDVIKKNKESFTKDNITFEHRVIGKDYLPKGYDLIILKDEAGSVYWPMFGLNSIGDLTDGKGYQAKMAADDVLVLEGNLVPYDLALDLTEGWGIMGYLHLNCNNAADMMAPVVDNLTILKDENGSVYWPAINIIGFGQMEQGKGYQIKVASDATFSYPDASGSNRFAAPESPAYPLTKFAKAPNTGSNMTIGIPLDSWEVLPDEGDEIAAYSEQGMLVGSVTFAGESTVVDPRGKTIAEIPSFEEGVLVCEIPIEQLTTFRKARPVLRDSKKKQ